MTKPPEYDAANVRHWVCDACGWRGPWTREHTAWASVADLDDGAWKNVVIMCSAACKRHMGADPLESMQSGLPHRTRRKGPVPVGLPSIRHDFSLNVPVTPRPGGQAA